MQERDFLLAIHLTKGLGRTKEARVIEAIQTGRMKRHYPWSKAALGFVLYGGHISAKDWALFENYDKAIQEVEHSLDVQVAREPFITYFDAAYPEMLRQSYQPPLILFYRGDLRSLQLPLVSVVGTRTATHYGLKALRKLLPEVIENGVGIVSGLAKGIDVMAHQITISAGGVPIGVVAAGLNRSYPYVNHLIQQEVSQQGLLLSEYPADTLAHRGHFPERNRIIAGLSSVTLVVEAKHKSGSLITANLALQNNREVMAVPGSIFSLESVGCNELIEAGSLPACSASAIMRAVKLIN
ncbi:DNA-processing protein DprA [Fructobacillus sp. W13]|uniref:DNA-processing protein DprA n=1 Tax=Fructobacillus apis TaxID=2935017 RepID=A0ABT0ZNG4_9LACO|nr:DNA-processing protein DprA [Fructobacillus apis]MCO0831536.1 DNA-processing protein DprA [Fructobacillus apis]